MRERLVILGGSGHARVIAGILEERDELDIAAFVAPGSCREVYGYPCLPDESVLPDLLDSGVGSAFVAIGDNARRRQCFQRVRRLGFRMINAVSVGSRISKRASLGEGVAIMAGVSINTDAVAGDGVILNTNSCLEHDCVAESWVHAGPGVSIAGNVMLREGVFLGAGVSVIPGITIGSWSTVGAGSVVVRDVPSNCVAWGVPARVHKFRSSAEGEWSTAKK